MPTNQSPFVSVSFCVEMATAWRCFTQHSKMQWAIRPQCVQPLPSWAELFVPFFEFSFPLFLTVAQHFTDPWWMCQWLLLYLTRACVCMCGISLECNNYVSVLVSLRAYSCSWTPLRSSNWTETSWSPPITAPAALTSGKSEMRRQKKEPKTKRG